MVSGLGFENKALPFSAAISLNLSMNGVSTVDVVLFPAHFWWTSISLEPAKKLWDFRCFYSFTSVPSLNHEWDGCKWKSTDSKNLVCCHNLSHFMLVFSVDSSVVPHSFLASLPVNTNEDVSQSEPWNDRCSQFLVWWFTRFASLTHTQCWV